MGAGGEVAAPRAPHGKLTIKKQVILIIHFKIVRATDREGHLHKVPVPALHPVVPGKVVRSRAEDLVRVLGVAEFH